ncbi:hypothetical protein A5662_22935 [Mycobacteriaceae bacterium 1482268.1]|nr:hypothetical protein A5662_22935 [Mycobacteriaceae bacterium 1482268.1]
MASRVRVAASACLVASGLFIAGAGGAIALADPGRGNGHSGSDHRKDESRSDNARRAVDFGAGSESDLKVVEPRQPRWGNGRQGEKPDVGTPPKETPTNTPPCPDDDVPPPGQTPPPPESAGGGGGGGGGGLAELPRYSLPEIPDMQLPGELKPGQPGVPGGPAVLEAGAGAAAVAPLGPAAPIVVPVIVAPPVGLGGGGAAAAAGPLPAAPKAVSAQQPPAGRIPLPANVAGNPANPSFRMGYSQYLRNAALPQVAVLAVPGLVGILVLTGVGGLMGYRQAKAGHAVRVSGSGRFMR